MKDIFRDNGIDPDILGRKRIDTELQLKSFLKILIGVHMRLVL